MARLRWAFWSDGMKTYTYIRRYFAIEVIATGIIALAALVICPLLAARNIMAGIMVVLMIPAAYQVWNTFIAIANPETVTLADDFIEFGAWGRHDRYELADVHEFRVREFPTAGKMYVRVNGGGLLRGRYWLQTRVMSDGRELFERICDMEYAMHPDSLKARARRVNSEYLAAEASEASDSASSPSRRHTRRGHKK